jgi:hypothetical protein
MVAPGAVRGAGRTGRGSRPGGPDDRRQRARVLPDSRVPVALPGTRPAGAAAGSSPGELDRFPERFPLAGHDGGRSGLPARLSRTARQCHADPVPALVQFPGREHHPGSRPDFDGDGAGRHRDRDRDRHGDGYSYGHRDGDDPGAHPGPGPGADRTAGTEPDVRTAAAGSRAAAEPYPDADAPAYPAAVTGNHPAVLAREHRARARAVIGYRVT